VNVVNVPNKSERERGVRRVVPYYISPFLLSQREVNNVHNVHP
jgi:hypothetical protein